MQDVVEHKSVVVGVDLAQKKSQAGDVRKQLLKMARDSHDVKT